jgi:hypothetical protein
MLRSTIRRMNIANSLGAASTAAAAISTATPSTASSEPNPSASTPTKVAASVSHTETPRKKSPSKPSKGPQAKNRILMLCAALEEGDTPQWPFWKWQHIKATRGVTEFAMLAVTSQDSFIATIQNGVPSTRSLKGGMKTIDQRLLKSFLDQYYTPNSYFVYGGHGLSDLLEFNKDHRMQVHELAECFGERKFLGVLFDACLMSSLDTAYHLRKNTPFIGASEGYMWEEDTWAENHMFNPYSASLMARDVDGFRVLRLIGEEYTRKSHMADYTVIDTSKAEALWDRVTTHHSPQMNASIRLKPAVKNGTAPVTTDTEPFDHAFLPKRHRAAKQSDLVAPPDFPGETTDAGVVIPRDWEHRYNYVVPNALFPEESPDEHIVDLGCYVQDDPATMELLNSVVRWRQGPVASIYSSDAMHGLNFAFSQYSYQCLRKDVPSAVAEELRVKFEEAATKLVPLPEGLLEARAAGAQGVKAASALTDTTASESEAQTAETLAVKGHNANIVAEDEDGTTAQIVLNPYATAAATTSTAARPSFAPARAHHTVLPCFAAAAPTEKVRSC